MNEKDFLDIGTEFLKEYVSATPEDREQFSKRISEMALTSDELLKAVNTMGEVAKTIDKVNDTIRPKENEDERTSKSLVGFFRRFKASDMFDEDFSFADVIAWLKKKGDQKQEKNAIVEKVIEWLHAHTAMSEFEYELMRKELEE